MSNLNHLFKINQEVKIKIDGQFYFGIVRKTDIDHIIVSVNGISDHMYFEQGFNLDSVYPIYN